MRVIAARANARFKALRALAADAREPRRQGLALLDGMHLVTAYCDKVGAPQCLVLAQRALARAEVAALLARLGGEAGVDCLCLADSLFDSLAVVATPTGVMALVRIPAPAVLARPGEASCLLLDAVQDAGNVGTILRSAVAAGIGTVYLGAGCASAWTPRVLRAAQGAHFDLDIREQADLLAVVRALPGRVLAAVAQGGEDLFGLDLAGHVAWLFGNEGAGVGAELLAAASRRVSIPMAAGSESLNVAAAATVCLFEAWRQRRQSAAQA